MTIHFKNGTKKKVSKDISDGILITLKKKNFSSFQTYSVNKSFELLLNFDEIIFIES